MSHGFTFLHIPSNSAKWNLKCHVICLLSTSSSENCLVVAFLRQHFREAFIFLFLSFIFFYFFFWWGEGVCNTTDAPMKADFSFLFCKTSITVMQAKSVYCLSTSRNIAGIRKDDVILRNYLDLVECLHLILQLFLLLLWPLGSKKALEDQSFPLHWS